MPSFFDRVSRYINFREYADSLCLKRKGLNQEICRLVKERLAQNELVFVLAQFMESFSTIQGNFDDAGVPYSVQTEPVDCQRIQAMLECASQQSAVLTLSQMLPRNAFSKVDYNRQTKVSVIVVERHPLAARDQQIIDAVKEFPFPTRIGFFLALDDALLSPLDTDWVGSLLRQMGSTDTDLISSHMVSRRVGSLQRRFQNSLISEQPANSAEEWIKLNASWCLK